MKGRKRLLLETKREAKLKETILTGSITIENIFDYAIGMDNMARLLASNLTGPF